MNVECIYCKYFTYIYTPVIYTTGSESDCIMTEIQEDLQRVEQWIKNSKLVLNLTKTKCMLFGTKQKLATASFKTQHRKGEKFLLPRGHP